jgi:hypothetical protein
MKTTSRLAALTFAVAALACAVPQAGVTAPATSAFVSPKNADLFGYYMPKGSPKFGKFALSNISLGGADEFKIYEHGKNTTPEYAPFMIEFNDVSSAKKTNEMGQPYYTNSARVLPMAYSITDKAVTFRGKEKQLGAASFTGTLDFKKLKAAKAAGDSNAIVLTGDLTVGKTTLKNLKFFWFGGD